MRLLRRLILVGILSALLISIALNVYGIEQIILAYRHLNALQLDPLGLEFYPTDADQGHLVDPDKQSIVIYGDSRAQAWPAPDSLPLVQFINRGIGSQTSSQILRRFDFHLRPLQPDIVLIQACVNDLKTIPLFPELRDTIIARCIDNTEAIIQAARDMGSMVILTTVFPVGEEVPLLRRPVWSDDIHRAIREVNEAFGVLSAEDVIVFDSWTLLQAGDGMLRDDYGLDELHLNQSGYAILNEALVDLLNSLH